MRWMWGHEWILRSFRNGPNERRACRAMRIAHSPRSDASPSYSALSLSWPLLRRRNWERVLGVLSGPNIDGDCRAHSGQIQSGGGLELPISPGIERLEVGFSDSQTVNECLGSMQVGSFCLPLEHPATVVLQLAPGSLCDRERTPFFSPGEGISTMPFPHSPRYPEWPRRYICRKPNCF